MTVLRAMLLLLLGLLLPADPADAGYAWSLRGTNDIAQRTERDLTQSGDPIAKQRWYVTDLDSSVVATVSQTGMIIERVSYSPFGEVRLHPLGDLDGDGAVNVSDQWLLLGNWGNPGIGDLNQDGVVDFQDITLLTGQWTSTPHPAGTLSTDGNTIGFTAHIYDVESGLLLARFRVYDAQLGRWLSPDPAGFVDGMNLYLYVRGNPLLWWDPLGLVPKPTGVSFKIHEGDESRIDFSLRERRGNNAQGSNGKVGLEAVLRMRRICGPDNSNRWLIEGGSEMESPEFAQLLAWAVENWGGSGQLEYSQDFRNDLAGLIEASFYDRAEREIREARAQAAEDLQPFIDALRTGGEIGLSFAPGGNLAVFLGTPNLVNAAAIIPMGGVAARVVGGAVRASGPVFKTTKEAADVAGSMGFRRVNERVHGQAVFTDGKRFITRDVDGHAEGGAWKVADSIGRLARKDTRSGTYSADLSRRVGD